ncbi:MAG TPA: GNAT family N-acetyltransferase [Nitrospirota bacterium]|nr:GNAT family N-acetyltransferase [Nitrospirota bacterium]
MADPKRTGLSGITGKMVVIRHASERDRVIVERYLLQAGARSVLHDAVVAVAAENERIIGFGLLKREHSSSCVSLFEDSRRKGIGASILRHLMQYSHLEKVYTAQRATYFTSGQAQRSSISRRARTRARGGPCILPAGERVPA